MAKYKHGVTSTKEEAAEMKTLKTLSCTYTEKNLLYKTPNKKTREQGFRFSQSCY
jgi:hypothetical protein